MKIRWTAIAMGGLLITACEPQSPSKNETRVELARQDIDGMEPPGRSILSTGRANHPDSEKAFAAAFADAVNSDRIDNLQALVHPACLKGISQEVQEFQEEAFKRDLRRTIPASAKWATAPIGPDDPLPFVPMFTYAVRPTLTVQVDFAESPNQEVTIIRQIVVENGKWWLVLPSPTAEALTKMHRMKAEAGRRNERARTLAAELSDPLRSELQHLLDQERRVEAIKRLAEATGEPLATAKDVVALLSSEDGQ